MGIVYCGPYADTADTYDHEGGTDRVRPDGTETGVWTYETREFTGYRAVCACGWRGITVHPPTEQGQEAAEEEWDRNHLRPLVAAVARRHTVTGDVLLAFVQDVRAGLTTTVNEHGEAVFTERSLGVLDAMTRLEELLERLAATDTSGGGW